MGSDLREESWIGTRKQLNSLTLSQLQSATGSGKVKIYQEGRLGRHGSLNIPNLRNGLAAAKRQITEA